MTAARFLSSRNLGRGRTEKGDKFGERGGELMFDGDGPDLWGGSGGGGGVDLPENVEDDITVCWVSGVLVGIPVGRVAMDFNVSGVDGAVACQERGVKEVGSSAMIPEARLAEGKRFARKGLHGIADEGFEPDTLENGFGKDGGWIFSKDVLLDPTPIASCHED